MKQKPNKAHSYVEYLLCGTLSKSDEVSWSCLQHYASFCNPTKLPLAPLQSSHVSIWILIFLCYMCERKFICDKVCNKLCQIDYLNKNRPNWFNLTLTQYTLDIYLNYHTTRLENLFLFIKVLTSFTTQILGEQLSWPSTKKRP